MFVVVLTLLIYSVVDFRGQARDAGREPLRCTEAQMTRLGRSFILIVAVLFLATSRVIHAVEDAPRPASALEMIAIAHQFWVRSGLVGSIDSFTLRC